MPIRRWLIGLALFPLALGACTSTADPQSGAPELPPKSTSASPSAEGASADEIETNERGNIPKELGQRAGFGSQDWDDPAGVTFSLDKVEIDPPCANTYATPPENGHTLLLHFRVATGDNPEYAKTTGSVLNPFNFFEITNDGLSEQARAGTCATEQGEQLPYNYGPNQKYKGTIEIVVPEASGTLVLTLPQMANGGGWEWHYPTGEQS